MRFPLFKDKRVGVRAAYIMAAAIIIAAIIQLFPHLIAERINNTTNTESPTEPMPPREDTLTLKPPPSLQPVPDFSSHAENSSPEIKSLIIAERDENYRVQVTAFNPGNMDVFVNEIFINRESLSRMACEGSPSTHYVLSDQVVVNKIVGDEIAFEVPVSPENGELSDYQYPAQGSTVCNCAICRFNLNFDSSFFLKPETYTLILIDVPKTLDVTEASSFLYKFGIPLTRMLDTESIGINLMPRNDVSYRKYKVLIDLTTDNGSITFTKDLLGTGT